MSHLDDVDFVFWGGPTGIAGVILAIILVVWACAADCSSADECAKHGEKYVDSRVGYTLCEQDGGTVVRR
jgi:hypothetical protein